MPTTGSLLLDRLMADGRVRARHAPAFDEVPWARRRPETNRRRPRQESILLGDMTSGYMVTPASPQVRERLAAVACVHSVPVDAKVTQEHRSMERSETRVRFQAVL